MIALYVAVARNTVERISMRFGRINHRNMFRLLIMTMVVSLVTLFIFGRQYSRLYMSTNYSIHPGHRTQGEVELDRREIGMKPLALPDVSTSKEQAIEVERNAPDGTVCVEKHRVAFPKLHKVGGNTIKEVLHHFGFKRRLSFLLPLPFNNSGLYPWNLKPEAYLPPQGGAYDILTYHTVYDSATFHQIMPEDTVYITIFREPLSHLKSTMNFYGLPERWGITGDTPVSTFLADPGKYDPKLNYYRKYPVAFSRNSMAIDLGFPLKYLKKVMPKDVNTPEQIKSLVDAYVSQIEKDFHLVMIMEHFDESMVLFRRMMCWDLQDILYFKENSQSYSYKHENIAPELVQSHRKWTPVDYGLYDHFNRTFYERISQQTPDFWDEVRHLKELNKQMHDHCDRGLGNPPLTVPATKWNKEFQIDDEFCLLATMNFNCYYALYAERNALDRKLAERPSLTPTTLPQKDLKNVENMWPLFRNYCVWCGRVKKYCRPQDYLMHLKYEGLIKVE
ncbi:galactose-3-O-sulfotransferase 3-like isoform X1 [Branchiostoma lanceolatum]|uniref:galactose-3-O-sulfotransferase 3-like isoform X1 n=2 Tax=Branchiostoma lanceolatum TaxID=7740 RepID=UPI0034530145